MTLSLPGGSSRKQAITCAHRCEAPDESLAMGGIAIANDIAWRFTPPTGFCQLIGNPIRTRVCGHIQSQKFAPRMPNDQKPIH